MVKRGELVCIAPRSDFKKRNWFDWKSYGLTMEIAETDELHLMARDALYTKKAIEEIIMHLQGYLVEICKTRDLEAPKA